MAKSFQLHAWPLQHEDDLDAGMMLECRDLANRLADAVLAGARWVLCARLLRSYVAQACASAVKDRYKA